MLKATVKALFAMFALGMLLMFLPFALLSIGSALLMMSKLLGILFKGSPWIYMALSVIISFLYGMVVFLDSE